MSNNDFIASGILELYAAGGLTQEERREVEARAASSPEIRAALDEACLAMEQYASAYAVAPRAGLKASIMDRINAETVATPSPDVQQTDAIPLYPTQISETSPYKWMFAASITLFLLSGFLSYHFYTKWQQAENRLAQAVASERLMAQNVETASYKTQQLESALSILRNPDYRPIKLSGVEASPDANMVVYWNADEQQVYVGNIQLPAPPAGMQYQLWALDNGKPIDAGMIALNGETTYLQKMKAIGSAQAFAVTLEPAGGSINPTLEKLTVIGEVKA